MILASKDTTVAYRCPKCGQMVFSMVGIFALSGDMIKLKCRCGDSAMEVLYTKDRKIRLTVPCVFCPNPHHFMLNSATFFGKDVFHLSCPYSAVDLCLIGEKNAVFAAATKADEEFKELLKQAGVEDFNDFSDAKEADDEIQNEEIPDPEMQSLIHFMLCELEDENAISCRCAGKGHYEFKFVGGRFDSVLIYCTECNASVSVPLPDTQATNDFLHIEKLRLT